MTQSTYLYGTFVLALQVFEPVASILHAFHAHKGDRKVQAMVCRSYAPILWRHLKSSHFQVRLNAATLFFDAYPVEDPDLNMEEKAEGHAVQLRAMADLLRDEVPEIRTVAVTQVSKIVARFWLVLSSDDLNTIFNILGKKNKCVLTDKSKAVSELVE